MKYLRQKRIDLTGLDSRWDNNCHIILATKGFLEVQGDSKKYRTLKNGIEKQDLLIKRLRNKIERADDEEIDALQERLDTANNENDKLTTQLLNLTLGICKDSFISGIIFDPETQANRSMKVSDLELFDMEILTKIVNAVLGVVEKKD